LEFILTITELIDETQVQDDIKVEEIVDQVDDEFFKYEKDFKLQNEEEEL
jgi:hypothetical protein